MSLCKKMQFIFKSYLTVALTSWFPQVNRLQYCDWVERDNSNRNALVWRKKILSSFCTTPQLHCSHSCQNQSSPPHVSPRQPSNTSNVQHCCQGACVREQLVLEGGCSWWSWRRPCSFHWYCPSWWVDKEVPFVDILDISHYHLLWLMMPTFPDGLVDSVFNGIPDWVYEEEVLGTNYAHYINE